MDYKEAMKVLELNAGFSKEELNTQHKRLARKYHPDNAVTADSNMFIKVQQAFEFLTKNTQDFVEEHRKSETKTEGKEICPMCAGTGKRREKIKTPYGYRAVKTPCKYCGGSGFRE